MNRLLLAALCVLFTAGLAAQETADESPEAKSLSTVKKFIGFVRYKKDEPAMKFIGIDLMARGLLMKSYDTAKPEELEKFKSLLAEYIRLKAFPLAVKYFQDIDLSYDKPVVKAKESRIKTSLLYAGSDRVSFSWVLAEAADGWLVVDFLDEKGVSSMQVNRDKQIQPVLKKSGMKGVNDLLEKQVKALRK